MTRYNDRDTDPEKISLCIFSALYAPSMGGVETYTESLAHALTDAGCKVTIATMNTHNAKSHERNGNVEIIRLPALNVLGGRYPLPKRNADYRAAMERLIESCPNYVVVNTRFYPLSLTGLSFARKLGIAPVHAMTILDKLQNPTCYAVSKKASAWLSHFGIASAGELPNAIDADQYAANASQRDFRAELRIPADALLVASAGRLIPEKGVLQLAQAAQMLEQCNANVQIAVAGAGPLENQLTAMNIRNVHLLGKLDRADLAALFTQADLYCLPSRSEGFATTLLETAACRTPAIVTNVGGTDELIPNASYGTIISDMEPNSIADALQNASSNRETLKAQGLAVGKRVREICSWKRTAELTLAACKTAQDSKRR